MAASGQKPSLLVIVGPTASGKSALAHKIALKFNEEIIAADSRTIYKYMDIGTAKPSLAMRRQIPYWGLDMVEPGQRFTAVEFKTFAKNKISGITDRGKLPILVGGSGLYIDAVLYNYRFVSEGVLDVLNSRHQKRGSYAKDTKLVPNLCVIGLQPSDEELRTNIRLRAEEMFAQGVVNETKKLMLKYGKADFLKTAGIVYTVCSEHLAGKYDLVRAKELNRIAEWQYVRRQRTWFKRNPHILWFGDTAVAYDYVNELLNK